MKIKKILLLTLVILLAFSGLAYPKKKKSGVPKWFPSGNHKKYSKSANWVAVGSGPDLAIATQGAKTELLSMLQVHIKGVINSTETELTENDKSYFSSEFSKSYEAIVDASVQGIEIKETAKSKGKYYALAVLNKHTYLQGIETELDEYKLKVTKLMDESYNLLSSGKLIPAIENMADAMDIIPKFYPRQQYYNSLSMIPYDLEATYTAPGILAEIRTVLSNISMEANSGVGQTGAPGDLLAEKLSVKLIYTYKGQSYPVKDLPIKASYANRDDAGKPVTDANGIASVKAAALAGRRISEGYVLFKVNLFRLPEIFSNELKRLETKINYSIDVSNLPSFSVKIVDSHGRRMEKAEQDLAATVTKAGFTISSDSKYELRGDVSQNDVKEISVGSSTKYQASVHLDVSIIDKSTGNKLGTLSGSSKKIGKSKDAALKNSLKSIGKSIKRKKLTETINDALK